MENKSINIGLAGIARSGKNLFADIFSSVIEEKYNLKCKSFALAYALKQECEGFLKEKFDINVWSEKTEDKNQFRELLVWAGKIKRQQTQGKYWTDLLERNYLSKSSVDVNIITDIRYAVYDDDEVYWLKNHLNGKLIHISKYNIINGNKIYIDPPNEDEALNNPILRREADIIFEWEHLNNLTYTQLITHKGLRELVYGCAKQILGENKNE